MQLPHRKPGEGKLRAARHRQPMPQVGLGLGLIQRQQVIARGDALGELAQLGLRHDAAQLRLAQQDDLQQFLGGGFQIGEQADLLQRLVGEVLRLVHDQHHAQAPGVGVDQEGVERIDQRLERIAPAGKVDLQLLGDALEQLDRSQARIEHQGHAHVVGQLLQQQPAQRGLSRAHLAGELHETAAAALADAVEQVRQRVAVALAQEDEARIGRDRERRFAQAVEVEVHAVHKAGVKSDAVKRTERHCSQRQGNPALGIG